MTAAAVPAAPPAIPAARVRPARHGFAWLVVALLVATSNLLLVNNVVSLKRSTGQNLVGVRDLLLLVALASLLWPMPRARARAALRVPGVAIALYLAVLTPLASVVGLRHGADAVTVLREAFTMSLWALPFVLAVRLRDRRWIERIAIVFMTLAGLLSIGVFVEAATLMRLRVVTSTGVIEGIVRPQPAGYAIMVVGISLAAVRLFDAARARAAGPAWRYLALVLVVGLAFLATLSRTFIVGFAGSTALYVLAVMLLRRRRIRLRRVLGLGLVAPAGVAVLMAVLTVVNTDFRDSLVARYSVFETVTSAVQYTETDTRRAEVERAIERFATSPIVGVGLGAPYREAFYSLALTEAADDPGVIVHNVMAFFLVRYGLVGFLPFLLFCVVLVTAVVDAARSRRGADATRIGFAVGMVNLLICGMFANVFGVIEGVPAAALALGCHAACVLSAPIGDRPGEGACT